MNEALEAQTPAAKVVQSAKGWLTDDEGNPSSMRLLSTASFFVAVAFGGMIAVGHVGTDRLELVIYFLVAAFAPKAVQKFAEKRPK